MGSWIVTYQSMPIEADSAEQAIAQDGSGGGHWQAYPHPTQPGALPMGVETMAGDADLPCSVTYLGNARVSTYQHFDGDQAPLPVVVVEVDVDDPALEVRVYANGTRQQPV